MKVQTFSQHPALETSNEADRLSDLLMLDGALTERDAVRVLPEIVHGHFPAGRAGLEVLDLGSDAGLPARVLNALGLNVTTVDMGKLSVHGVQLCAEKQNFDLINDNRSLQLMTSRDDRAEYLASVRAALAQGGRFVLRTEVLNEKWDARDSFETVRMDLEYNVWRQTAIADFAGVVQKDGRNWIAQKKVAPAEYVRQELMAAGFEILEESIEIPRGNSHSILRIVLG